MIQPDGIYEVCDVPRLLEQWEDRHSPMSLLQARAALLKGADGIIASADAENRAMNRAEQRQYRECVDLAETVNGKLAEYKRQRIAEHGADMVNLPF